MVHVPGVVVARYVNRALPVLSVVPVEVPHVPEIRTVSPGSGVPDEEATRAVTVDIEAPSAGSVDGDADTEM